MNTSRVPDVVTVGFDGSPDSERALVWAAREASLRKAPLHLLYAVTPVNPGEISWLYGAGIDYERLRAESHEAAEAVLKEAADRARELADLPEVRTAVVGEDPRSALMAASSTLVVVGSRGRGPIRSLLLGSVGFALARHAETPVAVVRRGADPEKQGVLVGTGGTAASYPALVVAFEEAALRGCRLTVVHCIWDGEIQHHTWQDASGLAAEEARTGVEDLLVGLRERHPQVEVHVRIGRGMVERCLIDLAAEKELVVLGRHGSSPLDHAGLGSVTAVVVEHASSVILVVPVTVQEQ